MKERPILFNSAMVRAILSGTKTQTRRVIKPQPPKDHEEPFQTASGEWVTCDNRPPNILKNYPLNCPHGQVGDRLWVRETIRQGPPRDNGMDTALFAADGAMTKLDSWCWQRGILPAIHCPRGLSRITLEITSVRVQRVQEISEEDAKCEGVVPFDRIGEEQQLSSCDGRTQGSHPHTIAFASLWDSIYIERGFGWQLNPWVWVIDFKRVQ